jgi:hypothetical protein
MQVRQSVPLVLAALTLACMKPNPLIYTLGDEDADEHDPDAEDADDADEAESMLPDMPDAEVCEPFESFEAACGECLALDCCDLALACADVDECLCLAECMLDGGSPGMCKSDCGNVPPAEISELAPLLECADAACQPAC